MFSRSSYYEYRDPSSPLIVQLISELHNKSPLVLLVKPRTKGLGSIALVTQEQSESSTMTCDFKAEALCMVMRMMQVEKLSKIEATPRPQSKQGGEGGA